MFRYLSDVDESPFVMDPFAAHRQQMRSLFGSFGFEPFPLTPQIQAPRTPHLQAGAIAPFGMMGMGGGGFMDMFGMMGGMMENMERMSGSPSCQTYSSSTVISYSSTDNGAPKVYQQTSELRTAPGGIRETRQAMRDSESGVERLAIGHHIWDRGHVMERSRNRKTGDREERQDYINLEESEAAAFDEEWRREAGRYPPPNARGLDYGRDRRAVGGVQQLALTAPPSSSSPPIPHHESPRHLPPPTRPRYDWLNTSCRMSIVKIFAREILDSRGNPTVEVDLHTEKGLFRAAVPSGASTGIYEALELRDGDKSRYKGKGVLKAVAHINDTIRPALIQSGVSVVEQEKLDNMMIEMDGTENKSQFGANAILGVSLAICKAGAAEKGVPLYRHIADLAGNTELVLPVPAFNVINGGSHAGNKLAMQEFMVLPVGAESFREALRVGAELYQTLRDVIREKYGQDATNVGDEGGFAPNILENSEALELLKTAIEKAGFTDKVVIGMDVAASEFYRDGKYDLDFKSPPNPDRHISADELSEIYQSFVNDYPVVSIEDPFDQDDWPAWSQLTASVGIQVVGDDLTVTNPRRIEKAVEDRACNCLLLKVNQIGSVTEAIQACKLAQENGWGVMVSHRSGETEDTFIADLVVGLCTGQIKTGAPCRSERLAKYNQLMRIEEELGDQARFAGHNFRNPSAL
ncbi:hypothetical protein AAFF_G00071130 [Aldrovandia affinis]|uniref:phosphopyruvate hydratase n=1 Tax=Aldrovandia affinis TaxID=143900 RepID=A0AAD7WEF0_9TELE|nr:hypothetical protein AAFF_G00071130 [Aldrovandia affinis]